MATGLAASLVAGYQWGMLGGVFLGMGGLYAVVLVWQAAWGWHAQAMVWEKLLQGGTTCPDPARQEHSPPCQRREPAPSPVVAAHTKAGHVHPTCLPSWPVDQAHWSEQARTTRREFLKRTKETAEAWRTIFAALLGLFGTVLLFEGPTAAGDVAFEGVMFALVMFALFFALLAVGFTGWASVGMPKMLVEVDAITWFIRQTDHAARSLARLQIGLLMGAACAATLLVAAGLWLSDAAT